MSLLRQQLFRNGGTEQQGQDQVQALSVRREPGEVLDGPAQRGEGQQRGPGGVPLEQAGRRHQQGDGDQDRAGPAPGGPLHFPVPLVPDEPQIGRASCRERV